MELDMYLHAGEEVIEQAGELILYLKVPFNGKERTCCTSQLPVS
jgi:hypothetical protein